MYIYVSGGIKSLMERRAKEGRYCPGEVLACKVCYGLLMKPYTLACGHTMCEGCLGKYRKCLMPGTSCRDAPSFVMMNSSGQVSRQQGGGGGRAREGRSGDVTATMNLALHKVMRHCFPEDELANIFKTQGNSLLQQGDAVKVGASPVSSPSPLYRSTYFVVCVCVCVCWVTYKRVWMNECGMGAWSGNEQLSNGARSVTQQPRAPWQSGAIPPESRAV